MMSEKVYCGGCEYYNCDICTSKSNTKAELKHTYLKIEQRFFYKE